MCLGFFSIRTAEAFSICTHHRSAPTFCVSCGFVIRPSKGTLAYYRDSTLRKSASSPILVTLVWKITDVKLSRYSNALYYFPRQGSFEFLRELYNKILLFYPFYLKNLNIKLNKRKDELYKTTIILSTN
jgi:hypothetical protein